MVFKLTKKTAIILSAVLVVIALFVTALLVFRAPLLNASHEALAIEVIETCSKRSYQPACYDEELPKLMDKGLSMEEVFDVTRIIQNKVPNYFFCHVLGHKLSEKETAKDPSKWTEVVARCPVGMCSNGCLHGAAQERFREEVLTDEQVASIIPELSYTCESGTGRNFTGLEQASCYHSLGHLTMYITGADIEKATGVCDQIARKGQADFTQVCYEGAYMQIFQPLEPEDFGLVRHIQATTTALAQTFCDGFSGERNAACHRESWPLYRETLYEPDGLVSFCSLVPGRAHEERCYNAMFYILTAMFNFDEKRVVSLCEGLPAERRAQCFANAASRFVETDYRLTPKAVALCSNAEEYGVGDACYNELLFYSSYNFHQGSEAFVALCRDLPEPWSEKCMRGEGKMIQPGAGYTSDSEFRGS